MEDEDDKQGENKALRPFTVVVVTVSAAEKDRARNVVPRPAALSGKPWSEGPGVRGSRGPQGAPFGCQVAKEKLVFSNSGRCSRSRCLQPADFHKSDIGDAT